MNLTVSSSTADFIHRLPKTETHLHIEGALPYPLLQALDPEAFKEPQPCWAPDFKWKNFEDFETHLIEHALKWFISPERYYEAAKGIFEGLRAQNVRYVETSFHAGMIEFLGIPGPEILGAIRSAAPLDMEVRVFMGMARNCYNEVLAPVLEDAVHWQGLAGFDLHGIEYLPLEAWTPKLWQKARAHGLVTKAHAGEFGPASHVREAIELLGVKRIQHGVRAIEDDAVVQLAANGEPDWDHLSGAARFHVNTLIAYNVFQAASEIVSKAGIRVPTGQLVQTMINAEMSRLSAREIAQRFLKSIMKQIGVLSGQHPDDDEDETIPAISAPKAE